MLYQEVRITALKFKLSTIISETTMSEYFHTLTQSKFGRQRQKGENREKNLHHLSRDIVRAFFAKNITIIFGVTYMLYIHFMQSLVDDFSPHFLF